VFFNSPVYILFLIAVWAVYWRLGFRQQNLFLLAASYFFYGWWDWRFLLLMMGSTTLDYWIALRLHEARSERTRKAWMVFSLVVNFAILGFFKYFNFFLGSVTAAARALGWSGSAITFLSIVLPPGISFYTFQEVAYIVDVYHRKIEPARSFLDYGLFISLFPHLIAGPIQQPSHLLPQVQHPRRWDPEKGFDGLMLILEGLFRKCVVADHCALIANAAFQGHLGGPNLPVLLLGMYAFAWQIYGDFSGYSNIARGSAQLLGFHFMVNFRQPYLATSLQDFWRRWHISLSTWLRDYLYIPLGGNRLGELRTYVNLIATMLLGGLWHGANWTFVVWGGLHGSGLAAERLAKSGGSKSAEQPAPRREWTGTWIRRTGTWIRRTGTWIRRIALFHLVGIAWIFFRADSISAAWHMLLGAGILEWQPEYLVAFQFLLVIFLPLWLLDAVLERTGEEYLFASSQWNLRIAAGLACFLIITFLSSDDANAFIYFQF
jgi:D-alanyl-lipoteichoic acid acyltransferase DltB (MBOAT superfamily)